MVTIMGWGWNGHWKEIKLPKFCPRGESDGGDDGFSQPRTPSQQPRQLWTLKPYNLDWCSFAQSGGLSPTWRAHVESLISTASWGVGRRFKKVNRNPLKHHTAIFGQHRRLPGQPSHMVVQRIQRNHMGGTCNNSLFFLHIGGKWGGGRPSKELFNPTITKALRTVPYQVGNPGEQTTTTTACNPHRNTAVLRKGPCGPA